MKEENGKAGVRNKKFYMYIALGCAAVLMAAAIIITAVALANRDQASINAGTSDNEQIENPDDNPVVETPEEFISPVSVVSVLNEYGFYYNKTLGNYYEHMGVDFTAEEGSEVYAVASGTVESVYTSDILIGTQITIDHGNGVKSVYQYVEAKEGLKAGDEVKQGDVIATVAEANGSEYKDDAHLHFEVFENGINVDPAEYLTLDEK